MNVIQHNMHKNNNEWVRLMRKNNKCLIIFLILVTIGIIIINTFFDKLKFLGIILFLVMCFISKRMKK